MVSHLYHYDKLRHWHELVADTCSRIAVGQSAIWIVPCPSKLLSWCCGAPHDSSCCDDNSTSFFSLAQVQPLSLNSNTGAAPNSTSSGTPSTSNSSTGVGPTSAEGSAIMSASCNHKTAIGAGIGVGATLGAVILIVVGCVLLRNQRSRKDLPRRSQENITGEAVQRKGERRRGAEGHELPLPSQMLDGTPFRPELEASGYPRV